MKELGPIYGVELLDTLPLGSGQMLQQLPTRRDLEITRHSGDRVAAGYEVLLSHYRKAVAENEAMRKKLHQRKCHDCGCVFWAADGVAPYCLCESCNSQDTRRVKGS